MTASAAPVASAKKVTACEECGRAHQPYPDCPEPREYHDAPFFEEVRRMKRFRGPPGCRHKGKRRFHDKTQAVSALHTIASRGARRERMPVRAYQCDFCKGWYLTSEGSRS